MKCSFGITDFLEEIPSLSRSVVFLYFFALISEEGFLISSCYSLELCIQMFKYLIVFNDLASNKYFQKSIGRFVLRVQSSNAELQTCQRHRGIQKLEKAIIVSDQISHSVVSDSLPPHESQHARPPCPSPTPGVH